MCAFGIDELRQHPAEILLFGGMLNSLITTTSRPFQLGVT